MYIYVLFHLFILSPTKFNSMFSLARPSPRFLAPSQMTLTTDRFLDKIGSFGRYQMCLLLFLNGLIFFWFGLPVMIVTFISAEPAWRCIANSTLCQLNGTMKPTHDNYSRRCEIPRDQWEFVDDFTSVVTEVRT